jgi:hypothetical protein
LHRLRFFIENDGQLNATPQTHTVDGRNGGAAVSRVHPRLCRLHARTRIQ